GAIIARHRRTDAHRQWPPLRSHSEPEGSISAVILSLARDIESYRLRIHSAPPATMREPSATGSCYAHEGAFCQIGDAANLGNLQGENRPQRSPRQQEAAMAEHLVESVLQYVLRERYETLTFPHAFSATSAPCRRRVPGLAPAGGVRRRQRRILF